MRQTDERILSVRGREVNDGGTEDIYSDVSVFTLLRS
jgi:hypothetical protein